MKPSPDLPEELETENVSPEEAAADAAAVVEPVGMASATEGTDYHDRWLRAEAELQNFRRRSAREREESRRTAEESVMLDVIAILDDLERALDAARTGDAEGAWLQGVELVATRMRDALARRGVEVFVPVGEPFDPLFHEAMLEVPAPRGRRPGEIVQVVLKGYLRQGRALRPARVVVARADDGGSA